MQQFTAKVRPVLKMFSTSAAHVERKVKVNGLDLNIVECGKGDKSVLLFPGGMGSIWTDFAPQIEQLPKLLPNHTIIAWDPPGYGKSVPPRRRWHLEALQEDAKFAVELMKTLERPKFSLVGWSAGGTSGLIAASQYAENIEKLVIWGTSAYMTPKEVKVFESMRDVSKWSAHLREPMEKVYGVEDFPILWNEYIDGICKYSEERNGDVCTELLSSIKAPTFILHGKQDPLKAWEHIPYLREALKGAGVRYHEFPEGKHNIHIRYSEEFNKLVADFLLDKC